MAEFEEIAHSGGKITVNIRTDEQGRRGYQQTYSSSRPNPVSMIAVWALQHGIPIASVNLGGIGDRQDPPPFGGCYMILIGSDSHGKFGHHCPACNGYWRSGPWPQLCPYCRFQDQPFNFLSEAQRRYVAHFCNALTENLKADQNGSITIDMDAVADAAGQEGEKPAFYVSEESQQHKFNCASCDEYNDVIGRFAYCSACGTRNDLMVFRSDMAALRATATAEKSGNAVRDAVSAFDNLVGQYTKQLLDLVPLSKRRGERLQRGRFHDLDATNEVLQWFDISVLTGLAVSEVTFLKRMFLRRHIYEHKGGEVDQAYLDASGDTSVRLKQHISESVEDVHRLIGGLDRMAQRLHDGFHELLQPLEGPIRAYAERLARQRAYR
jgi:hypothetical protein